jgi:hypothetical protein
MKRHNKAAIPLLVGRLHNKGTGIAVWCPYCKTTHEHGWNPANKPNDVERRSAHCIDRVSPFNETGYFIGLHPMEGKK